MDGEPEIAEPDLFAVLTRDEFKAEERFQSFEVDVEREKVVYGHVAEEQRQYELSGIDTVWDEKLLGRQCRDQYITQTQLLEFVRRVVRQQLDKGVDIGELVRAKSLNAPAP